MTGHAGARGPEPNEPGGIVGTDDTNLSHQQSRQELTAALRASVQALVEQTDRVADEAHRAAEAEARQYAEEAYERYATLVGEKTARLDELSEALVAEMDRIATRARLLGDLLNESVASLHEELGLGAPPSAPEPPDQDLDVDAELADLADGVEPRAPINELYEDDSPAFTQLEGAGAEDAGDGDASNEARAGIFDLFRRRANTQPQPRRTTRSGLRWATPIDDEIAGAPEGVRMLVTQMRLAGEPESAIAARLAEFGIHVDP